MNPRPMPMWFDHKGAKPSGGSGGSGVTYYSASSVPPLSPVDHETWYQTDTKLLKVYGGGAWQDDYATSAAACTGNSATATYATSCWSASELYLSYSGIGASPGYNGIVAPYTTGESLTAGDIVYFKSDSKVWKADANAAGLFPAFGLTIDTAYPGNSKILHHGFYRNDSLYNFTSIGGLVYLSTTAGGVTQTQPSATDDCIQILGIAMTADILYFKPELNYITHT